MYMQKIFIKRLIELMEEKDMTQCELANLIGTTNVTILDILLVIETQNRNYC